MSSGRRRSNRLIQSPWVFNWRKKQPEFLTIDDDGESRKAPGIVSGGTLLKKKVRGSVIGNAQTAGYTPTRLDIRSERMEPEIVLTRDLVDEEDAFMTPREQFSSPGRNLSGHSGRKTGGQRASTGRKLQSQFTGDVHDVASSAKQKKLKVGSATPKISETRKRAVKAISRRAHLAVRASTPKGDQGKTRRSYEGYIQKKFSPAILTDVMSNLSDTQAQWVKHAGFEHLLGFRMKVYTHRLAYRIADAFCSRTCELRVKAGTILVTESLVKKILGLPQGPLNIELQNGKVGKTTWDEQYTSTSISPGKVRDMLKKSKTVDYNFKMNFLILVYNFFIEANQNMYLSRRLLSFGGDIDECTKYNWCKLLIDKLRSTHEFWSEGKKWRNFSGPLSFLIFCYATCVAAPNLERPRLTYPTYICWTDSMLRERQNRETSEDTFGVGSLVMLDDELEAADTSARLQVMDSANAQMIFEGNTRDMVVPDSISGDSEEEIDAGCEGMDLEEDRNGCPLDELLKDADLMERENSIEQAPVTEAASEHVQGLRMDETAVYPNGAGTQYTETQDGGGSCAAGRAGNVSNKDKVVYAAEPGGHDIPRVGQREKTRVDVNATRKTSVRKAAEYGVKKIKVVYGAHHGVHDSPNGGQSTQARADLEIEKHFEEEPYMKRFEANMLELEANYNKCLSNYIESMALYPENAKLAELKSRYKQFFQMFAESSPITKSLSKSCANQGCKTRRDEDDNSCIPTFSLGCSQVIPKNLGDVMDSCVVTPAAVPPSGITNSDQTDTGILQPPVKVRPRRDIVPTAVCRSPFVSRLTDIRRHNLTAEEKDVWEWLCNDRENQSDYIFQWKDRRCTKAHFQSLQEKEQVESTVIDTWTYMLNENEILRADSSPLRIFLTSETIYGPMLMKVAQGDVDARLNRYQAFDDNMEVVLKLVNDIHGRMLDINEFEMFLFPVYTGSHHYIICYNIKKPRWEIIDNRVQEISMEDTYGDLPWDLHECFCQFLECFTVPKQREIVNLEPTIVKMSWQTLDNVVDCGVFVMRHLECYMGSANGWSTGLRAERDHQNIVLQKLRAVYAHRMLLWAKNKKRHLVLQKMVNYSKRKLLGD